jgi:hypothetical protein
VPKREPGSSASRRAQSQQAERAASRRVAFERREQGGPHQGRDGPFGRGKEGRPYEDATPVTQAGGGGSMAGWPERACRIATLEHS